jgi:thiamine-monophosphate kinase
VSDPQRANIPMGDGAEFDAIREMLAEWGDLARGVGDDAALLDVALGRGEQLVVSTDASVENVHFRREWMTPEEIGGRATAAALSDLAAMAASPRALLLALGVPESWREELVRLARGVGAMAERASCPIVGGNISRARELSLTITVLGSTAAPLRRSGARPGDSVVVTGRFGGPGAALRALLDGNVPTPADAARFASPVPRLEEARWLAKRGAHAAIDISDGLLADANHLARASGVTLSLDLDAIPRVDGVTAREAAASGEEYELLVALPGDARVATRDFAARFDLPLTVVGSVVAAEGEPVQLRGAPIDLARGHDHLS